MGKNILIHRLSLKGAVLVARQLAKPKVRGLNPHANKHFFPKNDMSMEFQFSIVLSTDIIQHMFHIR
jgi:hypothetical protein